MRKGERQTYIVWRFEPHEGYWPSWKIEAVSLDAATREAQHLCGEDEWLLTEGDIPAKSKDALSIPFE